MTLRRVLLAVTMAAAMVGCSSGGSDAAANAKRTNQAPVVEPLGPGSTR